MLIEKDDLAKMIKRRLKAQAKDCAIPKLACEGCKKEITLTDDPAGLDMSQPNRGGMMIVWHTKCFRKAWDSKI